MAYLTPTTVTVFAVLLYRSTFVMCPVLKLYLNLLQNSIMCLENSGGAGRIGVHRRESRSSALAYGLSTVGLNE